MTAALGTAVAEADALVTLGSLSSSFTLGTETVEVGTGVIVSVSTVGYEFRSSHRNFKEVQLSKCYRT